MFARKLSFRSSLLTLSFFLLLSAYGAASSDAPATDETRQEERERIAEKLRKAGKPAKKRDVLDNSPVGLIYRGETAYEGLLLVSPVRDRNSYLVDVDGETVRTWPMRYRPGLAAYLDSDGGLVRAGAVSRRKGSRFQGGGGVGGLLEKYDSAGNTVWSFDGSSRDYRLHHDFAIMPGGHVLAIAWGAVSREEAIAAGREPEDLFADSLWYAKILEIAPDGMGGANVVWTWDAWDYIIQDADPEKPNYGSPEDNPNRIDLNYYRSPKRGTGKFGSISKAAIGEVDWMHANSIDYDSKTGHILLSVHGFDEVWVIDKIKSEEGLAYRFGNPSAYRAGDSSEQFLFRQHDASWIPEGFPGEGNLTLFNNGLSDRSSVLEIKLPFENGSYSRNGDGGFKEPEIIWRYSGSDAEPLKALRMSGAQRLPNGNTLVCHGPKGRFLQVDQQGQVVWEYWNPYGLFGPENDSPRHAGSIRPVFKARVYSRWILGESDASEL